MLQRIGRGRTMTKGSWAALKVQTKLLCLSILSGPILSELACLALLGPASH
jgi:hypothetical protein